MKELIEKAGLMPDILKDPARRAQAIDAYNAEAGGLRGLMKGGKLEIASTHEIPSNVSPADAVRYLQFVAAGKRIPIIFAAGRATRMNLPKEYDEFGLAGLTPKMLCKIGGLEIVDTKDLSLVQRQLLQFRYQTEMFIKKNPQASVTVRDWLDRAKFAVVLNEENKFAVALQLAAVRFAGLRPEHVYVMVQPEEGGLEILPDGATKPFNKDRWPEGHGKPFLDMQADPKAAYCLNARGHLIGLNKTFVSELSRLGVERAVFAQVNDLHLLEDMAHAERWLTADTLIQDGAEMVMEMVENGLKQKGGGIFTGKSGAAVMRDTIAMKSPDLEPYSVPKSLSRMFYELTLRGMSKLDPGALPAYLTERKSVSGKAVLTREYYSGDASGVLSARAMQRPGYELDTFKIQARIPQTLEAIRKQDAHPDFTSLITHLI